MLSKTTEKPAKPGTMVRALQDKAYHTPHKIAYRVLNAGFTAQEITFSGLFDKVGNSAGELKKSGITQGDICLLVFPQGIEFIVSFLACNMIGAIPVPLNIPGRNKPLEKWEKIANDCKAKAILTDTSCYGYLATSFSKSGILSNIMLLETQFPEQKHAPVDTGFNEIAFLQYTSGSTGNPKGVMVTHESLLSNSEEIRKVFSFNQESVMVSWLPFYHDMGLILGILQGIYTGHTVVLLHPHDFMNQPLLWLKAISHYKATHTSAPNFAYELAADKLEKPGDSASLKNISLSSLKRAVCGAEPIHLDTLRRFNHIAATVGLKNGVICPGYGLAEATLVVTTHKTGNDIKWLKADKENLRHNKISVMETGALETTPRQETGDKHGTCLVSNGTVIGNHSISIRDTRTEMPLGPFQIGEVWFSGPSVTKGYLFNEEATQKTYVKPAGTNEVFLRTGDLGFLDETGELYITGRSKDVIIIKGANLYPQDIERTAFSCSPFLRTDGAAAFPITKDNQEKLVIVQEITREALRNPQYGQWTELIKKEIIKNHEVIVDSVVFVPPLHVPRTTSGKIQRSKARTMYLDNEWSNVLYTYTREETRYPFTGPEIDNEDSLKEFVAYLIAHQLDVSIGYLDKHRPFQEMGINSMMSLYIKDDLERTLGIPVRATDLFNYNTVTVLSRHLWKLKTQKQGPALAKEENDPAIMEKNMDEYTEDELLTLLANELNDQP